MLTNVTLAIVVTCWGEEKVRKERGVEEEVGGGAGGEREEERGGGGGGRGEEKEEGRRKGRGEEKEEGRRGKRGGEGRV